MSIQAENETSLARPETGRESMRRAQKLLTAGGAGKIAPNCWRHLQARAYARRV